MERQVLTFKFAHSLLSRYFDEKLPEMEEEFREFSENNSVYDAVRWRSSEVIEAKSFDYYTKTVRDTLKNILDNPDMEPGFYMDELLEDLKADLDIAIEDSVENLSPPSIPDKEGMREGRKNAVRNLRSAKDFIENRMES